MLKSSRLVFEANEDIHFGQSPGETYRKKRFDEKSENPGIVSARVDIDDVDFADDAQVLDVGFGATVAEGKVRENVTKVGQGEEVGVADDEVDDDDLSASSSLEENEDKDSPGNPLNASSSSSCTPRDATAKCSTPNVTVEGATATTPATTKTAEKSTTSTRTPTSVEGFDSVGEKDSNSSLPRPNFSEKVRHESVCSSSTFIPIPISVSVSAACMEGERGIGPGVQPTPKKEGGGVGTGENYPPALNTNRASGVGPRGRTADCTAAVQLSGCSSSADRSSPTIGGSVVHEQQEGSEVKSFTEKNENKSDLGLKICRCESWPPVSSLVEVDVDAPILLSAEASQELCVECGLQVVLSPLHEVLLSILQERDKFLTPPTDVPPPPPPPTEKHPPNGPPTSCGPEAEDVGVSDLRWPPDLFVSREDPISVDSPQTSGSDSDSDVSTVICVDIDVGHNNDVGCDAKKRPAEKVIYFESERVTLKTQETLEGDDSDQGRHPNIWRSKRESN